MPSKLVIGSEIGPVPFVFCTTGSLAVDVKDEGCKFSLSRAVIDVGAGTGRTGRSLTAGDSPL